MTKWAQIAHKQTIWRVPQDRIEDADCRTDRVYITNVCVAVKCRLIRDTSLTVVVDGEECAVSGTFQTYDPIQYGDRFFLTEDDKNSGDLNRTHKLGTMKESPELLWPDTVLREVNTV